MNMPSDFSAQQPDEDPRKKGSWFFLPSLLLVLIGMIFVFYHSAPFISSLFNPEEEAVVTEEPMEQREESLPQPPRERYEFYNALSQEAPHSFDPPPPAVAPRERSYFLLVEYFHSYDAARIRSRELQELGIRPAEVEPFARQGDLKFRIRAGPYSSQPRLDEMRDILSDNHIPHRLDIRPE